VAGVTSVSGGNLAHRGINKAAYNRIATDWDRARASFCGREREYIDALLEDLPAGSAILDLGCGTGRPIAEHVLAQGHHVTGVDQAAELLALARHRFPQATWIEYGIEDFTISERYAAIICWDALFHLDRSMHGELLARMAESLTPRGRIMITVGGSDHPAFTDTMFGETFFYDSHPPERVLAILDKLAFVPLIAEFMNEPTSGRDKGRYAIVAQRRPLAATEQPVRT
jgi:2-polyprenyl-3-methyl-5-hydroxy-6-metoxy-1,4-benzoquinol methylase